MELELPYGPWNRLASAEWGGYPVGLYMNADKILMLILYEKHGEQASGMLVSLKKVFVTDLDLTKTMQTQRREMTVIQKMSGEGSTRYLLVGSTPAYCKYTQESLVEALGKQFNELRALSQFTLDLATAYKSAAKELKAAGDEATQQLLGDPFLMMAMYNPAAVRQQEAKSAARVYLGLDLKGQASEVSISDLSQAVVFGSSREERLHMVHLLCEAALMNNIPCLLFDSTNAFAGLAKPNKDTLGFTQNQMTPMPLGFPFQEIALGKGIYIDLSSIPPTSFLEAFGLQETDVGKILEKALGKEGVSSLKQASEQVRQLKDSREATQYAISKSLRCLQVIEMQYPSIFGKNPPAEVLVPWHEGIGKVFRVNTKGYPATVQYLLISSLLRIIPFPKGRSIKALVGFDSDLSEVYTDVLGLVADLRNKSAGFVMQAEHELDVEALQSPSLKVEIVKGEAVASVPAEKPQRFKPRPAYTECTETTAGAARNAIFKAL